MSESADGEGGAIRREGGLDVTPLPLTSFPWERRRLSVPVDWGLDECSEWARLIGDGGEESSLNNGGVTRARNWFPEGGWLSASIIVCLSSSKRGGEAAVDNGGGDTFGVRIGFENVFECLFG